MKAVALFDTVGYLDADGNVAYASKGDEFDLDQKQFDRKAEEGAVAKAGSKEANAEPGDAEVELTTPGGEPVDKPSTTRKKNEG